MRENRGFYQKNKNNMPKKEEDRNGLGESFQTITQLNYQWIGYSALIYGICMLHHFFPELYSLYTFGNLTLLFLCQLVLFVLYKREYFSRVFSAYQHHISTYFEVTNLLVAVIVFIGLFVLYGGDFGLSGLSGFLEVLWIGYLYNAIYRDESIRLFE